MTDRQFDNYFSGLSPGDLLEYLGKIVRGVKLSNGEVYRVDNYDDLIALIEQEIYQEMTGRE